MYIYICQLGLVFIGDRAMAAERKTIICDLFDSLPFCNYFFFSMFLFILLIFGVISFSYSILNQY